jgi:hypothetical protein
MYLLDDIKVPPTSYFCQTSARCLAITINIALRNRDHFVFFQQLPYNQKNKLSATFEKKIEFNSRSNFKAKMCMADHVTANIFFRLLYETWSLIYRNSLPTAEVEYELLEYEHEFKTNEMYLVNEPRTVRNSDIISAVTKFTKNAVFVANAYGFKTYYNATPSGFVDICNDGELTSFAKKTTYLVSESLSDNFNKDDFPDHLIFCEGFRHDLCPVVFGFDIGLEITPLSVNCSLVGNGYAAKMYLKKILKVKKTTMESTIDDYKPTGTFTVERNMI